jgi:hypothetical protein
VLLVTPFALRHCVLSHVAATFLSHLEEANVKPQDPLISFPAHEPRYLTAHSTLTTPVQLTKKSFFCCSKLRIRTAWYLNRNSDPDPSSIARSLFRRIETPTFDLGEVLRQYQDAGTNADQSQLHSKVRIDG